MRVFLDANVLFSAAYREGAGLVKLWQIKDVELVTSEYAVSEAHVNLEDADRIKRLVKLAGKIEVLPETAGAAPLPKGMTLPDKDVPIMQAAIRAGADYLLTGDLQHFGSYFGKTFGGVTILRPAEFLEQAMKGR